MVKRRGKRTGLKRTHRYRRIKLDGAKVIYIDGRRPARKKRRKKAKRRVARKRVARKRKVARRRKYPERTPLLVL